MTHVNERVAAPPHPPRYSRPLAGALAIALLGGSFAISAPFAAANLVVTDNGWSYTKDSYDTGVRNGYQLTLDAANRKVYLTDAAWSTQTRTVTDNGDGSYTHGDTVFNLGSGKLAVFDTATRAREADHSFLGLTRNDGSARENEPFSWPNETATSINSMRTTFSPYGVAVDGTTEGGATIITTTARQRNATAGYGGGVVVYSASEGAPTDADRVFEFDDGTPILQGPRRIAVNTVTHKAYVTSLGTQRNNGPDAGYLTEIDLVTRQVTARIAVPGGVGAVGVAVDEATNLIYTGAMAASKLYVIDGDEIDRSDAKSFAINESAVTELAADLDGNQRPTYNAELKRLYISTYASPAGKIYVVDADPSSAAYGTILDTIVTGPTNSVEVDGQRGLIYSANLGDQNVVVFDAATHEELLTLPTSANALNIGIDPVSRDVWVSNFSNAAKVDVFTVTAPTTETTSPAGGTLITPSVVPLGSEITVSGRGFFLKNGDGGSAGPVFINQSGACTGTGAVNVAGRVIENQIPGSTFADPRAHGVFLSDAEGNWTITIPFPTPANSTLTAETAWKVGDVQCIRILTGSLVPDQADHSRSVFAHFTVSDPVEPPAPVEDQAAATVPSEWVDGQPLTVTGTGWTWPNGTTGSTIGIKLNGGGLVPVGDPHGDVADNVYAVVEAADGSFSVDLPFPGEGAVEPGNTPAKAGDQITIHFLTGSLAPGDRVRSVSKTVTVVAAEEPEPVAPVAKTVPSITGTPVVGSTLTATTGTWSVDGVSFSYQWLRDGAAIPGATKASYTVTTADAGKNLQVKVTASKAGLPDGSATSAAVKAQPPVQQKLTSTPAPTLSGTAQVGKTLTVKVKAWQPAPVKLSYQWLRNGKPISKATKVSYKLTKADAGQKVAVKVTGSKSGYPKVAKTSAAKTIAKVKATVKLTVPKKVAKGKKATVKVTVSAPVAKPTGTVKITVNGKTVKAKLTTKGKGKVSVKLPTLKKKGSYKVKASFTPSGTTAKSTSASKTVTKTLKVK